MVVITAAEFPQNSCRFHLATEPQSGPGLTESHTWRRASWKSAPTPAAHEPKAHAHDNGRREDPEAPPLNRSQFPSATWEPNYDGVQTMMSKPSEASRLISPMKI